MKVWRKLLPARFEFLAKNTIQMHNILHDIPDMNDSDQTQRFSNIRLRMQ